MKFKRWPRHPFTDTSRKRSYVAIRHRREQEKFPLFAAEIAEGQPDVDTVMRNRAERWVIAEAEERAKRARDWVAVRRWLKLLPDSERLAFLEYYYRVRYPLDGAYMRSVLADFCRGRLVMVDGRVMSQAELNFLAERRENILAMTDDELLLRMQSPYCVESYLDELRAERARRQRLAVAA